MKNRSQFVVHCFILVVLCASFSIEYNFSQSYRSSSNLSSKKVLIIEPAMSRHALPIKNLILTTIKNELNGICDYEILRLDEVSDLATLGTRSDTLKILKRATERAIKEIIAQEILSDKQ